MEFGVVAKASPLLSRRNLLPKDLRPFNLGAEHIRGKRQHHCFGKLLTGVSRCFWDVSGPLANLRESPSVESIFFAFYYDSMKCHLDTPQMLCHCGSGSGDGSL